MTCFYQIADRRTSLTHSDDRDPALTFFMKAEIIVAVAKAHSPISSNAAFINFSRGDFQITAILSSKGRHPGIPFLFRTNLLTRFGIPAQYLALFVD